VQRTLSINLDFATISLVAMMFPGTPQLGPIALDIHLLKPAIAELPGKPLEPKTAQETIVILLLPLTYIAKTTMMSMEYITIGTQPDAVSVHV
jgi:hypothetical protein